MPSPYQTPHILPELIWNYWTHLNVIYKTISTFQLHSLGIKFLSYAFSPPLNTSPHTIITSCYAFRRSLLWFPYIMWSSSSMFSFLCKNSPCIPILLCLLSWNMTISWKHALIETSWCFFGVTLIFLFSIFPFLQNPFSYVLSSVLFQDLLQTSSTSHFNTSPGQLICISSFSIFLYQQNHLQSIFHSISFQVFLIPLGIVISTPHYEFVCPGLIPGWGSQSHALLCIPSDMVSSSIDISYVPMYHFQFSPSCFTPPLPFLLSQWLILFLSFQLSLSLLCFAVSIFVYAYLFGYCINFH